MTEYVPVPVPEDASRQWTESAFSARFNAHILSRVGAPKPGSNFAKVAELYPFESVAERCHAYLRAASEHLHLWADLHAPLKFHPDQRTRIDLRPAYTLSRAAMEASAHALWIFGTLDPIECVRRHIALLRWDLEEHRKSKPAGDEKRAVQAKDAEIVKRVSGIFTEKQVASPGSYFTLFQQVCKWDEYALDIAEVELVWRAASGAAHGKYWVGQDLQVEVETQDAEGNARTVLVPDTDGIARALELASSMCGSGVGKLALWSGYDPIAMSKEASRWVADNMTYRDDADPETVARMKAGTVASDPSTS
jgi:hypothetical protein